MYGRGIFVNQNGTWVEVKNPQVKQGSTWVPIKKGFTNINGVWTQFWPSTGSMSYSSVGSYTFTVPYGIYTLNISAAGGGGGGGGTDSPYGGSAGYPGRYIVGSISVNPNDTITIGVGGGGQHGNSGTGTGDGTGGISSVGYSGGRGGLPGQAGWSGGGGGGGGGYFGGLGGLRYGGDDGAYAGQTGGCYPNVGFTATDDPLGYGGQPAQQSGFVGTPGSNGYATISW